MTDPKKLLDHLDPLQGVMQGLDQHSATQQAAQDALSAPSMTSFKSAAETDAESIARAASGTFSTELTAAQSSNYLDQMRSSILGVVDVKEQQRIAEAQEMNERIEAGRQMHLRQMEEQHAAHERELEKIDYARRSAEASEAALTAERERRVAAEEDATRAREAEGRADARADRAEKREIKGLRQGRIGLWFGFAGVLLAAWAFLKDYF